MKGNAVVDTPDSSIVSQQAVAGLPVGIVDYDIKGTDTQHLISVRLK
jgi:hypothetical protein